MARSSSKNADQVKTSPMGDARSASIPRVRGPFDRPRVAISFDPDLGRTHQSFRDECDINRIVETYARTGIVPTGRREPQYGEAPDGTLFDHALVQAAIRTAVEDGYTPSEASSEAPDSPEGDTGSPEPEKPLETASEAADA